MNYILTVPFFKPSLLKSIHLLLGLILFFPGSVQVFGQQQDTTSLILIDTAAKAEFTRKLQKIGSDGFLKSVEEFNASRVQGIQRSVMSQVKNTVQEARIYLGSGFDSLKIEKELALINTQREIVEKGVFDNDDILQSDRNLAVSRAILWELFDKANSFKEKIQDRSQELFRLSYEIDSLSGIEEIYKFSSDSVLAAAYAKKFVLLAKEIEPTFNALHYTLNSLDKLQSKTDEVLITLQASILEIERRRGELNREILSKEVSGFANVGFSSFSFWEVVKMSHQKEVLALILYFEIYSGRIITMLFLVLLLTFFISNVKVHVREETHSEDFENQHLVLKNPFFSSLIIIIGIFQFFFPSPPFVFYFLLWMIAGISLSILFRKFLSKYWMVFWVVVLVVFFISNSINLLLAFTQVERIAMLILSFIGVLYGIFLFANDKRVQLKERRILYFVALMLGMQSLSLIFNLYGSLNFSKALLVSGFLGVVLGIILLWAVRLINQLLALASNIYNKPDKKLFFINFDKVGEKVPSLFYMLLTFGWVILVGRNFYAYHLISGNFTNFLNAPQTLGSYDFTINGLFIFFVILVVSVLLSRIVSFFSSDPDTANAPTKRKSISLGSWLLLVQIFIISMGLFLAVAASGIPLDKITIVLGALGVGIGLGLQGLFNNLVSGVIIAFENPVKVGDLIEINGKPGVMKSIGFRSSVVNMYEGASIIIPNGDLLGQQLVNWTMGKGKKVSIVVGVAYGTDLEQTAMLIKEILKNDSRIHPQPIPRVLPLEFNDSRIDLEIAFWVTHYLEVPFVKGDIINQIDVMFKKQGIVIPFPQRDIHFRSSFETQKGDLDEYANTGSPEKD
ncbi:mechanosensitive ion channel family protein [Cognataquiflexum rubidum]|uniref:mechanosensitive ion channel family protein n=1 Tax=Cognataquiflexum rubidum TaxID=2922273 RepID=UPI001F141922|nr:mechanosensitive ion channel domain-containing protein [Cognataquiflexum rubidum]MCH6234654.1 mechanosensitive ion channel [Cognataquiflexum rubidum]